jgi:glycosyltransferase involved in cell wall biosynthesis
VSRPQLSIVLPTRDRPAELDATLSGVTRQLDTADRLLVVDSASRGPAAVAEVARRHGADVLRMEQPGAARARNAGWQTVSTEIVVFVDDTLVVADGWLDALVAPLADDPGRGFVSGRIDPVGGREGSKPIAVHRAGAARPVEAGDPAPGDSASLAVRVAALRDVGGFDERLGPGTWYAAADDLNLLDRILLAGWTGWYEPAARAGSPQPEGRGEIARKVWDYGKASGGRLALLARRDRAVARQIAPQVLPAIRRRPGMADDEGTDGDGAGAAQAPGRTPLLALVRAAGTVTGFAAGLLTLRRPAPPPTAPPGRPS